MLNQNVILCFLVLFSSSILIVDNSFVDALEIKIEQIPDSLADMGEGPHWDNATKSLFYVDINAGKILRYSYIENKVYKAKVLDERFASFIIPIEGKTNLFAVGCGRRVLIVKWNGISPVAEPVETLFEVQINSGRYEGNRFNDAKCDSQGRLFAGTMRYEGNVYEHRYGELYKFEMGRHVEVVKSDVGISNGLAWNEAAKKFYFADTADFDVKEYNYDIATGEVDVTSANVILDLHRDNYQHIQPDGLTIDTIGNVYVATFNGSMIYKVQPRTREILLKLEIPCLHVTSLTFGGPNLDILFVTTATEGGQPSPCGFVFKISGLGAQGNKMHKLKYN